MQFAGCLNNPTRSDLAGEAEKAALRAEHDLAQQKLDQAQASATRSLAYSDTGKVVVAGGAEPHSGSAEAGSGVVQTAGEIPAEEKSSFWSFLKPKPKKPPMKDPFADQPELKTAESPHSAGSSPTSGKARLASSSSAAIAAPEKPQKPVAENSAADNWFDKEFGTENPQPSWDQAAAKSLPLKTDSAPADSAAESSVKLGSKAPAKGMLPPADDSSPWARESSPFKPAPAEWSNGKATGETPAAATATATAASLPAQKLAPASAPLPQTQLEAVAARQQRLRIQALMSEAHTCALRGELHAAYRCALLAEKVSAEHHIAFAEGEENPHDFAKQLAAKIWKTSNASDETYLAATEAPRTGTPTDAAPAVKAPVTSETAFPANSFATWEPLPNNVEEKIRQKPEAASLSMATVPTRAGMSVPRDLAAPQSPVETMPEIRPWTATPQTSSAPQGLMTSTVQPPTLSSPEPLAAPALTRSMPSQQPEQNAARSESGVQFAIAHSVSPESSPQLVDPFAGAALPAPSAGGDKGLLGPMLMAPPIPEEDEHLAQTAPPMSWEELSRARSNGDQGHRSRAAESAFKWRLTWSILGLIGAGIATWIGVKVSRMDLPDFHQNASAPQPAPSAAPVAQQEDLVVSDEAEIQPLQFKRAA